jgi:large subunit ribosomal protein L9
LKVILITDIKDLGSRGQIIEVKDGYANNYLIPQNLAMRATRGKTREVEQLARMKMARADRDLGKARDVSARIREHDFVILAKVGVGGKLFGTITPREISEHIKEELGIEVDRKKIHLEEHIKHTGYYEAKLKLHHEEETVIHIKVVSEDDPTGSLLPAPPSAEEASAEPVAEEPAAEEPVAETAAEEASEEPPAEEPPAEED